MKAFALFMLVVVIEANNSYAKDAEKDTVKDAGKELLPKLLFFNAFRTSTETSVVLSTKTVFAACVSSIQPAKLCPTVKRRRRFTQPQIDLPDPNKQDEITVEGSMEPSTHIEGGKEASKNEPKFGLTAWRIVTSSQTVTVKYTNTSTTLSLGYSCTVAGMEIPPFSCRLG